MDNLDFLDAPASEPAVTPEPVAAEPAAPVSDGPARGPDGKFVPKAHDAPAAPESPQQAVGLEPEPAAQPGKAPDGFVPLATFLALRDEVKELKRQPPPQPAMPQFRPGDEGYEEWQDQQANDQVVAATARVQIARHYAVKEHGEELVTQAQEWARQRFDLDPMFRQQAMSNENPVAFAIEEYQHFQALQMLRDPKVREQFTAWASGAAQPAQPAAAALVAAPASPPTPPRSLASLPSAGGGKPGEQPVGPGVAFDHVFKG